MGCRGSSSVKLRAVAIKSRALMSQAASFPYDTINMRRNPALRILSFSTRRKQPPAAEWIRTAETTRNRPGEKTKRPDLHGNPEAQTIPEVGIGCVGRIRTCDLQAMSLMSRRAAPPRAKSLCRDSRSRESGQIMKIANALFSRLAATYSTVHCTFKLSEGGAELRNVDTSDSGDL